MEISDSLLFALAKDGVDAEGVVKALNDFKEKLGGKEDPDLESYVARYFTADNLNKPVTKPSLSLRRAPEIDSCVGRES